MPWTAYNYQAGPKGGALTPLSNLCTFVRVVDEGSAGKRGSNVPIQYFHGAREVPHKFTTEHLFGLECGMRYTDSAGTITHTDGAPGHVFDNLETLKRLLYGGRVMTTLQREAPDYGTVQIDVEVAAPVTVSQNRFVFLFPLLAPDPFWHSTTLNSQSPSPSISVGGNAPVDDAEIVFPAAAASPLLTHTASGATIQISGTVPSGGVRVYARTGHAARVSGGGDYSEFLVLNKNYVLELDPGATNSFTYSGGGSATIEWRNKWR
jgi:hypothetical protein